MTEYKGTVRVNGYACSPLAYRDTVIVQVGGAGHSLMAFDRRDGRVVWKAHDFRNSNSSPIVIDVDGRSARRLMSTRSSASSHGRASFCGATRTRPSSA